MRIDNQDKNLRREAQFGGVGGGGSSAWSPGGSPLGGGTSRSMGGDPAGDVPLDAIMSRTHRPADMDPTRNIEKRLESFHDYAEDDDIPYNLSLQERLRLKIRKQIRRREKELSDYTRSIDTNSVPYIQSHFSPSPEQMVGIEVSLEQRRKYKPEDKPDPRELESPPQDAPTRRHSVSSRIASPSVQHGKNTIFGPHGDDEAPVDPYGMEANQKSQLPTFVYNGDPLINSNADFENALSDTLDGFTRPGGPDFRDAVPNQEATYEIRPDSQGYHQGHAGPAIPSPVKTEKSVDSPYRSLEQKTRALTEPKSPDRLPNDPIPPRSVDDSFGQDGINQAYPSRATNGLQPNTPRGRM